MAGIGHGHMGNLDHQTMVTSGSHCEHINSSNHSDEDKHCVVSGHNHPMVSSQGSDNFEEATHQCTVCALCTSILPAIDVDAHYLAKALPFHVFDSTSLLLNLSSPLERPPRS